MMGTVRVGIVGDYAPDNPSHPATDEALLHTAGILGIVLEAEWLPTSSLEADAAES